MSHPNRGESRRRGVTASERINIKSALYPVVNAISEVGSGPSVLVTAWYTSIVNGARQAIQVKIFSVMSV